MPASTYFRDVQKLYLGYYGREADAEGLAYWASRAEQEGGNLGNIISQFANSNEANQLYGNLNNLARIDKIYQQVFGRLPDSEGAKYYAGKLDDGTYTPGSLVFAIIQGARNEDLIGLNSALNTAMNKLDQIAINGYLDKFLPTSNWTESYAGKNYGGLILDATILQSEDGFGASLDEIETMALSQLNNFNAQKAAVAYLGRDVLKLLDNPYGDWTSEESGSNGSGGIHLKIGQYHTDLTIEEYASYVVLANANQFAAAWYPLALREESGQNVSDAEWLAVLDQVDDPILQLIGQYGLSHEILMNN